MAITFVQKAATTNGSGSQTSVTCTFPGAQTAGNLIIVSVTGNSSGTDVTGVTDSKGNTYVRANLNDTFASGPIWNTTFYAKNIAAAAAGANTVTVALTSTSSTDVRIFEFSGLDPSAPLDQTGSAHGSLGTVSSASVTTTTASELLFGSCGTAGGVSAYGTGWTGLEITSPNTDADEYQIVAATGSYAASFTISPGGPSVVQIATFKAASGGAVVVPPPPTILRQAVARAASW